MDYIIFTNVETPYYDANDNMVWVFGGYILIEVDRFFILRGVGWFILYH
jgi:hypothetical protein